MYFRKGLKKRISDYRYTALVSVSHFSQDFLLHFPISWYFFCITVKTFILGCELEIPLFQFSLFFP